jgi:hypothetical protein
MASSMNHLPINNVFKYKWKGNADDSDAIIDHTNLKGLEEDGDKDKYCDGDQEEDTGQTESKKSSGKKKSGK